jgi:hypothetical protein
MGGLGIEVLGGAARGAEAVPRRRLGVAVEPRLQAARGLLEARARYVRPGSLPGSSSRR